jgi:3-hydroxy-9,10-secoandrosta-1,3,5(10)-triene-9,17-dione monooxygenase
MTVNQYSEDQTTDLDLVERAVKLAPLLKGNAAETERLGHLTEATAAALRESGLFRLSSPRRYGGLKPVREPP